MLISCAVTPQLICDFVFAYAKIRFSHDTAHLLHDIEFGTVTQRSQITDIIHRHVVFKSRPYFSFLSRVLFI